MNFRERIAEHHNIRYVHIDNGNIGILSNGGGLCMATLDLLTHFGGKPANFLELGGSTYDTQIINSLIIMEKDEDVTSILLNIFAGDFSSIIIGECLKTVY